MKRLAALVEDMVFTLGFAGGEPAKAVPAAPRAESGQAPAKKLVLALPATENECFSVETCGPDRHALVARIDYAARRMEPLCAKPRCAHQDSGCGACELLAGSDSALLAVAGGRLLVLRAGTPEAGPRLVSAALDGSDPKVLCTLPVGLVVDARVYTDGENLYALADAAREGAAAKELWRFSLGDGGAKCLYALPANTDGTLGSAFGNCLCLDLMQHDPRTGEVRMALQLYHVDTEKMDPPLLTKPASADGGAVIYGKTLVEMDTAEASRAKVRFTDLCTGKTRIYDPAPLFARTGLTSAWLNVLELWDDWYRFTFQGGGQFASYNVNIRTGEAVPMDLYYPDSTNVVLVLARQGGRLLVRAGWDQQWSGSTLEKLTPVYALMDAEDYLHSRPEYRYIRGLEE